eukprot:Gb_35196 [translate_table: standard]
MKLQDEGPVKFFPKFRKRSADSQIFERIEEVVIQTPPLPSRMPMKPRGHRSPPVNNDGGEEFALSEKRRALFEPLGPTRGQYGSTLLPPPDFDAATYPRGWVVGKKRKLVNVDVVESMRRIAVHEMNRKDREIDGLNEQLEEDARCLEHLQLQLQQERTKRVDIERENAVLQNQIAMLTAMIEESEDAETVDGTS